MKKLQHPRGNTAANDVYTGLPGQLTIDSERWEIRLHDGETPGGHRILNLAQLVQIFMSKDSEFGNVSFSADAKGILTRVGDRQYALRSLIGFNGIKIKEADEVTDNPKGTEEDFYIGFDDTSFLKANRIFIGVTTGTAPAFELDVPAGFINENGTIFAVQFHADVASFGAASLQLNIGGVDGSPQAIRDAHLDTDIGTIIRNQSVYLLMNYGGIYFLLNEITAQTMDIRAITGLTATNVQDALEELAARTGAGGNGANAQWAFSGSITNAAYSSGYHIPLAAGQTRLVLGQQESRRVRVGPAQQNQFEWTATALTVNGVSIGGSRSRIDSWGQGPGITVVGMLERNGNNIYWWPIQHTHSGGFVIRTGGALYSKSNRIDCGDVSSGATSILMSGAPTDQTFWQYSAVGAAI